MNLTGTQIQILSAWVLGALAIATISGLIRHYKIQWQIRELNDEPQPFRWHSIKDEGGGMWRAWLTIGDPDYRRKGVDFHWEFIWGKKARSVGPGFRIHLGDRGSETPFHWDILLGFAGVFFSMNTPNMGKLFERIGRGHKRNISLRFHGSQAWWELWYDEDGGYDNHHKCDTWEPPKFWPFRNKKHRGWRCLRRGNIPLNPLTLWWGDRFYSYATLETDTLLIEINQFKGDEYMVDFKVQEVTRARRSGPKWARRWSHEGYVAEWECFENGGIPTRNHAWKGDGVMSSSVKIEDPINWRLPADLALKAWILDQRKKNGYRSPDEILKMIKSATPIFDAMQGKFLELGKAAGNAGKGLKQFAAEFEERLKADGGMIILPEGSEMTLTPLDNEELKAKYSPAELAQQAINRDKDL